MERESEIVFDSAARELSAISDKNKENQRISKILEELSAILGDLDSLGCSKSAAYVSMAIEQLKIDFAPESE